MPKKSKGRAKQKAKANEAKQGGQARKWAQNFVQNAELARDVLDDDITNFRFQGFQLGNNPTPTNARVFQSKEKDEFKQPLRKKTVAFVSAGNQTPTVPIQEQELQTGSATRQAQEDTQMADDGRDELQPSFDASALQAPTPYPSNNMTDTDMDLSQGAMAQMSIESSAEVTGLDTDTAPSDFDKPMQSDAQLFMVDTAGDTSFNFTKADGKRPPPAVRAASPDPSSSGEEVVFFKGRNKAQPKSIEDPVSHVQPQKNAQTSVERCNKAVRANGGENQLYQTTKKNHDQPPSQSAQPSVFAANNMVHNGPSISSALELQERQQLKDVQLVKEAPTSQNQLVKDVSNNRVSPEKEDLLSLLESTLKQSAPPQGGMQFTSRTQASIKPSKFPAYATDEVAPAAGWMAAESSLAAEHKAAENDVWAPSTSYREWKNGYNAERHEKEAREMEIYNNLPAQQARLPAGTENVAKLRADWNNALQEKRAKRPVTQKPVSRKGKRGRKQNRQLVVMGDETEAEDQAVADYMQNIRDQGEDVMNEEVPELLRHASPGFQMDESANPEKQAEDSADYETMSIVEDSDSDDSYNPTMSETGLYEAHPEIFDRHMREFAQKNQDQSEGDYDSSDLEKELAREEQEDWEDEVDLRQRRVERMTDEKLARLFEKQQELGISGDELVLETGDYSSSASDTDEHEGFGDVDEAREGLERLQKMKAGKKAAMKMPREAREGFYAELRPAKRVAGVKNKKKGKGKKDTDFAFPSATGLADFLESEDYGGIEDLHANGFDIMDLERDSLQPARKTTGRRGKQPAQLDDLSDEDLQGILHKQWSNDRDKKRAIKAHRSEQRMLGTLKAHGGPADLHAKYSAGITKSQLVEELTDFLFDDGRNSCPLPPMATADRKGVHQAVMKVGLSSKSVGKGKGRFTVVNKTSKTIQDEEKLARALFRSNDLKTFTKNNAYNGRSKFNKWDNAKGTTLRAKRTGGTDGEGKNREGAVVAQHATPLGEENKGFAMLQKMGWAKGQGLGGQGEGRLVPVEAMIKTSKMGLGQGSGGGTVGGAPGIKGFTKGKSGMGRAPRYDWD